MIRKNLRKQLTDYNDVVMAQKHWYLIRVTIRKREIQGRTVSGKRKGFSHRLTGYFMYCAAFRRSFNVSTARASVPRTGDIRGYIAHRAQ
ncbi:hypothetical protein KGM_212282 [Danaus plexippus plexippus]|uniref:Uncharacterized protein n=1 Tax=Danaus plexippus plexippus TaxID=278856 RepID=A0A212FAD9_DANPL|nr:hypothetical protein KGM_212282 [Danaus plexippus plexippus]